MGLHATGWCVTTDRRERTGSNKIYSSPTCYTMLIIHSTMDKTNYLLAIKGNENGQ